MNTPENAAARARRQVARRARRASLLPVAAQSPGLLYWGVVYADAALSLVRGAGAEHLVRIKPTSAARAWAKAAPLN